MFILQNVKHSLQNVCNLFNIVEQNAGVTGTMRTPGTYYAAIAAFCAVCLVIGFAGATDQGGPEKIPCPKNWTGKAGDKTGQPFSTEQRIARLEGKGIDVTEVKAALEAGDSAAVKTWFARQGRPGGDTIKRVPDVSMLIDRLEQEGVDVTEVKTAIEKGDRDAVKAWLDAHRGEGRPGDGSQFREGKQGKRTEISGACDRPCPPVLPENPAE